MTGSIPHELIEARKLLEQAESTKSPTSKLAKFKEWFQILRDFIDEDLETSHKAYISNIIKSHTRVLLQQIDNLVNDGMFSKNFELWCDYFIFIALYLKDVTDDLIKENIEIEEQFNNFRDIWKEELIEAINRYT